MSLYTVKAIIVLESTGARIVSKYFVPPDDELGTPKSQEAFEAKLFKKAVRQHAEIVTFDSYAVVYKSRADVTFYVVGSQDENELILLTVLNTLRDSLDILLTDTQVEKRRLLENLDYLLLVIDELVDNGIFLEYDAHAIANRVAQKGPFDDDSLPITEQTVSQVFSQAAAITQAFLNSYSGGQ